MEAYEKTGYLNYNFKLFHIRDQQGNYEFHYHEFHKVIFFLEGDVTYQIEGQSYQLKPHDIILVPAGMVHRAIIESPNPYERIILYVSDQFLSNEAESTDSLERCFEEAREKSSHVLRTKGNVNGDKLWQSIFHLEEAMNESDYADDFYRNALFCAFLVLLNRTVLHHSNDLIHIETKDSKISSVMDYLSEHLSEDIAMDDLAKRFFISKFHLMRRFKEETGYTIYGYLNMKRLLKARALITSGTDAADACFSCGFRNYSTFFRAYKKYFSVSPRQTR